ncbi:MAG: hypothetical protein KAH20_02325 [Methylococcales bacterium]|nr:hypothetical protein [Methylococcales bacterium]
MEQTEDSNQEEKYPVSWKRLLVQGIIILLLGLVLSISSIVNADAIIMSAREFSWLPVGGLILFFLGVQECFEAFFAKISREFHQNLQVGILDTVVGGLIVFSVSDDPQRLSLMIAAFLIVRGAVRIILARVLCLPHAISTSLCGFISIISGILICFEWPSNEGWFLSFCLNMEIAFRGWAIIMFGLWIKKKKNESLI